MQRLTAVGTALALAVTIVSGAAADGLPVVGATAGPVGVASRDGDVRYSALRIQQGTVVVRTRTSDGQVLRSRFVRGRWSIPVVAYDGTPDGLSADGHTLVLIRPRITFPRARTPIAIIEAKNLRVRESVTLKGDFSFDAISPDGSALYFIEYLSAKDPTDYAVRVFDTRVGRFLSEPIVDPDEPAEEMGGQPITRAWSADGRWAYTLYDGGKHAPFVHALDTVRYEAHCIDLDALAGRNDLQDLRLSRSPSALSVVSGNEQLLAIDLESFDVSAPSREPALSADKAESEDGNFWLGWTLGGVGALMLAAAVVALFLRHRRLATS
jgi:hypothetical protein